MKKQSLRQRLGAGFYAASGAIASTAMVAAPAFAGGGGGIDTSSITDTFTENKLAAVAIVIAFAVVLWAIRGATLLKPK